MLVVKVFDGRDPLLAVALQRGSPCVSFEGGAHVRVVWLEGAAAGVRGLPSEVGRVGLEAFKVRPKAPMAGPICDKLI